ncbi:MAG: TRAP transporter large permease subunit, partial [Desulfobacterales bacterium]|nr:TRAP transporter large permease subunit [Desulfobacterales bacterium]
MQLNEYLVIAMFITFIGLLFTGFPIAWILAGTAIIFTCLGAGLEFLEIPLGGFAEANFSVLSISVNRIYKLGENQVLVALPMFIYMGFMLDSSGIAEKMMVSIQNLFGKVRGGLAVTVCVIGIILAASTG